ncbi:MAG: hypothetical protein FWG21_00425 [Oscillospiraceae bacterium]|nr:hypothetical protein [Oscillospiraceae bacterium]
MISILATDDHYNRIVQFNLEEELNRRGFWNIIRIPEGNPVTVNDFVKSFIIDNDIENVLIDIDVYENKLKVIELIKKLSILSGFDLYIAALGYTRKDTLIKHLLEVGVDAGSIFTGSIDSVCKLLASNILKEPERIQLELPKDTVEEPERIQLELPKDSAEEPERIQLELPKDSAEDSVLQIKTNNDSLPSSIASPVDAEIQDMLGAMNSRLMEILGESDKLKRTGDSPGDIVRESAVKKKTEVQIIDHSKKDTIPSEVVPSSLFEEENVLPDTDSIIDSITQNDDTLETVFEIQPLTSLEQRVASYIEPIDSEQIVEPDVETIDYRPNVQDHIIDLQNPVLSHLPSEHNQQSLTQDIDAIHKVRESVEQSYYDFNQQQEIRPREISCFDQTEDIKEREASGINQEIEKVAADTSPHKETVETVESYPRFYTARHMAATIGVIGAGRRVGTTTQALQIVQYLKTNGYSAAVIEMNQTGHLLSHLRFMPEHMQMQHIQDSNHFTINNIDIYRMPRSIIEAKSLYDYVVCDYGDRSDTDITSFLERDVKVVVGCIKPYEVKLLEPFFSIDSKDLNYIYSFVDRSLWDDIRDEMGSAADRTYFAGYAPDIFRYASDNHIYEKILPETNRNLQKDISKPDEKKGLSLSKLFQIKITKEEINGNIRDKEQIPSF